MSTPDDRSAQRDAGDQRLAALAQSLGDPPRRLPAGLVIRLRFGVAPLIGSAVFGFGMIFWWLFADPSMPFDDWALDEHAAEVVGSVAAVQRTGATENSSRIYRYRFTFRTPQGAAVNGVCYWAGQVHKPGADAPVQYLADRPEVCRIKGLRRGVFSPWVMLVGLIPIGGIATFLIGTFIGRLRVSLLTSGQVSLLPLLDVRNTATQINNQRVKKYVFEAADAMGMPVETACRTHLPIGLNVGDQAWVVYDPSRPAKGLLLRMLADRLNVDSFGQLSYPVGASEILRVLVPAVCIIPHLAIWLARAF